MKSIILHPNRNFLDARNPSSPFQYRQQMAAEYWKSIYVKYPKRKQSIMQNKLYITRNWVIGLLAIALWVIGIIQIIRWII